MLLGILMFVSFIIFLAKTITLQTAARYHILVDIAATSTAAILLGSTLGGLTAAIVAGILLSLFFWVYRAFIPIEYKDRQGKRRIAFPKRMQKYGRFANYEQV